MESIQQLQDDKWCQVQILFPPTLPNHYFIECKWIVNFKYFVILFFHIILLSINMFTYILYNNYGYYYILMGRFYFKNTYCCPDQCGSVGWVSSHKVKGCQLDSWSGAHACIVGSVPSPGVWEGQLIDRCFSLTLMVLSLFLPPPLFKINT